jgi:secreted PhoX family phosphatase
MNSRRMFLKSAAMAGGAAISVPFECLWRNVRGYALLAADGYGPLKPVADETTGLPLIELPDQFRYLTFGWMGDRMDGGRRTPGSHDGMAAFASSDGLVALIRNHELNPGPAFDRARPYDRMAGGGTTTVWFDPKAGKFVRAATSLSGTLRNCAGGPTPWGTWLTCEETTLGVADNPRLTRNHGYVFEVPVHGTASAEPLTAMGRFVHEAAAVDDETGIVYQTEDQRRAGLYRFIPKSRGRLQDGGTLEMLAIVGRPRFDTRTGQESGTRYAIRWVPIADPGKPHFDVGQKDNAGVFTQGLDSGGAIFGRLEGACYSGGRVYITATDGGNARTGQVWELDIREQSIRLLFESPGSHVLNMPDNIAMSPRGGLVLCEDNRKGNPCVHGVTREGQIVRLVRNACRLRGERNGISGDFRDREFTGATFSPDGRWLFLNMQSPGLTLAITGPWNSGIL